MNDIAKKDEPFALAPVLPRSDADKLLDVFDALIRDSDIPMERVEKAIDLRDRIVNQARRQAFDEAFALMQPDLPVISEKGEIKVNSEIRGRYAKWPDVADAIMPIIGKHGFTLRHRIIQPTPQTVTVVAILGFKGYSEETSITLPIDTSGAKNAVQAVGSSTSYGQRYTTSKALALRSRYVDESDDDGRAGGGLEKITDEQASVLLEFAASIKADLPIFYAVLKIDDMAELPAKRFPEAMSLLKRKEAKNKLLEDDK